MYYILNSRGAPVKVPPETFFEWLSENKSCIQVFLDEIGPYKVSTIFLGIDHNFTCQLPGDDKKPHHCQKPILWETMIIGPDDIDCCGPWRYPSLVAAGNGHAYQVAQLRLKMISEGKDIDF